MEAFAPFFWLFFGWIGLVFSGLIIVPILNHSSHKRERDRKLAMMKQFPHLAGEILKSMEVQDADYRKRTQNFSNGIASAFDGKKR